MQRESIPSSRGPKFLLDILGKVRLGWRLLRDPSVPAWSKLIPIGTVLYLLFPLDFIPDVIPGLGQLDDLTLILLGLKLFIDACPKPVVEKHRAQMNSHDASYRVVSEESVQVVDVAGYLDEHKPDTHDQKQGTFTEAHAEGDPD